MSQPVTVLLGDHRAPMRAGVRTALESHGIRVLGETSKAADAVRAAVRYRPDICLLAAGLPGDAVAAAERITEILPETKIVMLGEPRSEEDLFVALRAGAVGYLSESTPAKRLPHAIRGVAAGEAALPRSLTSRVLREFRESGAGRRMVMTSAAVGVELTPREFEVLQRLRQRAATSAIARELKISDVTVRRHISAILHKLGVRDRRSALELLERHSEREQRGVGGASSAG